MNITTMDVTDYPNIGMDTYDETDEPVANRLETYIVPILFAFFFIIGVLGNGILILTFVRHREMRTVTNTYVISLALGDLLIILISMPFASTVYTLNSWPYGLTICKLSEMAKDLSVGVSVFTLTALSVERYFAISNPVRRFSSKSCTIRIIAVIWLVATLFALPSAIFSHIRTAILIDHSQIKYCYSFPEELGNLYRQGIVIFKFLANYAVPLSIIACFYGLMAKHLEMTRNMPGGLQNQEQARSRKEVAKIVISFIVIFIVCFLPHHIFMLWFHLTPDSHAQFNDFWNIFRIVSYCLSFSNSCINPIAVYFISDVFRKYFNRYLFICCRPVSQPTENVILD